MLGFVIRKIFGTRNDRVLASLWPLVKEINKLEDRYKQLSDTELQSQTALFKERIARGESLDSLQCEAFAVVREASRRVLGMRHFDVQLLGGSVLHLGRIAEMKTGEGKTLVATLPAYLNALAGRGVHVVTVNDYLAKRDSEWMGKVYNFLGLSVGVVVVGMNEAERQKAYRADITYGQNNEFGFDYLRDNMKFNKNDLVQRDFFYAIVDEVDSILIDEARTPLIISGPAEDSTELYANINKIIPKLSDDGDYEIDLRSKQPTLSEEGIAHVEKLLGVENLYDPNNIEIVHHVNQALKAHTTLVRDVDYVVKDGEIIIVDEFTGRLMPGRRWSDGLHQAVEAKESLKIARENQTLASVTFQNYFRMYDKLSGMTGTADTEAVEFKNIYDLEVVVVPTNRPMVREDRSDRVYRTTEEKYAAVVEEIAEISKTGQPVLVGTISIDQSEKLAKQLRKQGVNHQVLNAKHHEHEAEIVAQAGREGAVTISTNMAGRGTDIVLGGNPEFLALAEVKSKNLGEAEYESVLSRHKASCEEEKRRVLESGGLHILGTERHESRRIDNQLRGRSGRQGDPGSSQFFVSLEDDLMKRFGGDRIQAIMNRLGWDEGAALDGRIISRSIETAQTRVEGFHFDMRKHLLEYDDVMNKQRQVVYNLRRKILAGEEIREQIFSVVDDLLETAVFAICDERTAPTAWKIEELEERFQFLFNEPFKFGKEDLELSQQNVFDSLRNRAKEIYATKISDLSKRLESLQELTQSNPDLQIQISRSEEKPFEVETIEQDVFLETLDHLWKMHLQEMDHLREGIGLRGYGQKNPLHEYQREGFLIFQAMLETMKEAVVRKLFYYQVPDAKELLAHFEAERERRAKIEEQMRLSHDSVLEPEESDKDGGDFKDPKEQRAKLKALRHKNKKR